jgi:hypothetical protein
MSTPCSTGHDAAFNRRDPREIYNTVLVVPRKRDPPRTPPTLNLSNKDRVGFLNYWRNLAQVTVWRRLLQIARLGQQNHEIDSMRHNDEARCSLSGFLSRPLIQRPTRVSYDYASVRDGKHFSLDKSRYVGSSCECIVKRPA